MIKEFNPSTILFMEKSRLKTILRLSLPITASLFGSSLMGIVDIAMVGRLGNVAMASIGIGNALFMLLFTVAMGLGAGVQAMVARRIGEGNTHLAGYDLNAGVLIGGILGLSLMILGYLILPFVFPLMNQDPQVVQQGIAYLRARLPQVLFWSLNLGFRSYWNGTSMSEFVLLTTIIKLPVNIALNFLLIFGNLGFPRLEVTGAGLATALTTVFTLTTHFILGLKYAQPNGFLRGLPERERIQTMIRVSIPVSVSQIFGMLASVAVFIIAGLLGTEEVAIFNVISNIVVTLIIIASGLGTAVMTLVGQALGRRDINDAKKWGWEVATVGFGTLSVLGVCLVLFPHAILAVFIIDAGTVTLATVPLQISGLYVSVLGASHIIGAALVGAGATKVVMTISLLTQWCFTLPLQWLVGVYFGYGLTGIYLTSLILTISSALVISFIWHKERWALIEI